MAEGLRPNRGKASNVILFIGDGMGISTVTAARIFEGQRRGEPGEENFLSFERFPYLALSKTYNTNQQTPDSAGTMTAMMTGVKTKAGVIGVDENVIRGDCASARGHGLRTFLEEAEMAGMATGVISTARVTHATPAATYAHVPERNWEDDHNMPEAAKAARCKDIARQLLEFPYGDGIEVVLGGGRRGFLPHTKADPEYPGQAGEREDGRDLTREWLSRHPNAVYVWNQAQFQAVAPAGVEHLLGLFEPSHMKYHHDRPADAGGEPTLPEMTAKAIDILQKNPKGYFLMVEGGRIDHAHHAGNAFRALDETIELAKAVRVAMQKTDPAETLIIVTADHSHVLTIGGYPTRGNPILGKVVGNDASGNAKSEPELAADGLPYTTLSYANGRGFAFLKTGGDSRYEYPIAAGRHDLSAIDTTDEGYHQEALVPLGAETHAGEDVAIYATGAGAYLVHGVQEQNVIFHVMRAASRIDPAARRR
ncbi:alkaline phosphatase [Methylomarinovum caldicuralii]|uniref:Alkaline phosphatase n=1 Tax=Methylomarinovum caldicuralii TaxID=438856 RepID=A0AAU9BZF5_9GAMM|nr:alkaline phosphatase [Methylomarinovum caldicuralii]BCX80623.1 alkaline phosphatase [Methylomarinovum caldicuralii]